MLVTILFGAIFLIAGAFLVITQIFNPVLFRTFIRFWPLLISVFGLFRFRDPKSNKKFNITLIAVGAVLTVISIFLKIDNLFVLVWGALLILLGAYMLLQKKNNRGVTNNPDSEYVFEFDSDPDNYNASWEEMTKDANWTFDEKSEAHSQTLREPSAPEPQAGKPAAEEPRTIASDKKTEKEKKQKSGRDKKKTPFGSYEENIHYTNVGSHAMKGFQSYQENVIREESIFATRKKIILSEEFNGGKISSIFSTLWLDLSRVKPKTDIVTINANVIFSTVRIRVPDNWVIYMSGNTIFGSTEIPETPAVHPICKLYISNEVTFGTLIVEYKSGENE